MTDGTDANLKPPFVPRYELVPVTQAFAFAFCKRHHRKLKRSNAGSLAQIGARLGVEIVGVAILGRPARMAQDGRTCQVLRVCVEGHRPNLCSWLNGRAKRLGHALGYTRVLNYNLPEESGASLLGSNWIDAGMTDGGEMSRPSRPRAAAEQPSPKRRWITTMPPITNGGAA